MEIKKPIENILKETLENLRGIVDANSIIGSPIEKGDCLIVPISRVSFGFVSGGGEYNKKRHNEIYPFAGGSGGGCNISPIGFLVVKEKNVQFIKINIENNVEKIVDLVQDLIKNKKM